MKFKKLLGAVCSFLLATTSLLCGGPASAKDCTGQNVCVFMVNSGEDLGNGERDGDECDKACWGIITKLPRSCIHKKCGYKAGICGESVWEYLMLNPECPTALKAIENMTYSYVPDVLVVVANLSKDRDNVIKDINKHLKQISDAQKKGVLYRGPLFNQNGRQFNKEVYLNTVPVVMYGVVPKGMEQKTSDDEFVEIAAQIKRQRNGEFENIHNNVYVRQSNGNRFRINMDNKSERRLIFFFNRDMEDIANDESSQSTSWLNYHDGELPRREEDARRNKIVGGTLVGLSAVLAIGSTILSWVKYNQNKKSKGNKTKVPKAQKMQVSAIS